MPKLLYTDKNFAPATEQIIRQANAILEEYAAQGFTLTLRQLYYQFVARDLIRNVPKEYDRLGSIINDARLAGRIDWQSIVDRTRNLESLSHWKDPSGVIETAMRSYHVDKWARQPLRVEVWIEKDALVGVIEGVCQELDVPYFSCRGYTSQSEMWAAAQRLGGYIKAEQQVVILHFGDHDPSGLDMSRDIEDRLQLFLRHDWARFYVPAWIKHAKAAGLDAQDGSLAAAWIQEQNHKYWGDELSVRRLALTRGQIDQYSPPPNPAKVTDSRFEAYRREHGDESWELDALEPAVLASLIRTEVEDLRNEDLWFEATEEEERGRTLLKTTSKRWGEVETFLSENERE